MSILRNVLLAAAATTLAVASLATASASFVDTAPVYDDQILPGVWSNGTPAFTGIPGQPGPPVVPPKMKLNRESDLFCWDGTGYVRGDCRYVFHDNGPGYDWKKQTGPPWTDTGDGGSVED